MQNPEEVVTVYKAANSAQAHIVRNALQAEGIECQVAEANEPFAGLSIVEPDVMVKVRDVARAEQLISEWEARLANEPDGDDEEDEDGDDETDDFYEGQADEQ
jgi:hypothetical protein